jgi:hypothetical protein
MTECFNRSIGQSKGRREHTSTSLMLLIYEDVFLVTQILFIEDSLPQ